MSIHCNFFTLFFACLTALLSLTCTNAYAADCNKYRKQIEHYENLRRNGGNAKSMSRWTATGHQLEEKYYHCNQDRSNNPVIQIVSGNQSKDRKKATRKQVPLRKNTSDNPQLKKLTQTCNYWIGVTNEIPTKDNVNFRETACQAVDNYQSESETEPATVSTVMVRKLKDCIKSNNLIDHDVNECMKGTIEPDWKN